ncbi:Ppx/GppA phosphatase family protein [Segnochrobactraceae bacterium EtOH-i3]
MNDPTPGRGPPAPRTPGTLLYGALDLGTNNCRLLIAEPRGRAFRVVDAFSRIVRLGEGIAHTGALGAPAMDRAVEALGICARKLSDRGVKRMRLVATEACRAAGNGSDFLSRVTAETGLRLEVLSQRDEARLAVSGSAHLIDREADGAVLFDIGGGSTEVVWIDLAGRRRPRGVGVTRCIRAWASLPVGVVTLAERFGGRDVTEDLFEKMVAETGRMLDRFRETPGLDRAIRRGRVHLLGTSGTVTTLAGVHLELPRYDRRRVDGVWLGAHDVDALITRVRAMSFADRVSNPCIGPDRADLVLAGCAILEAIRRRWPCRRLRVADRGLREGILMEMMTEDGVFAPAHAGGSPHPGRRRTA